MSNIPAHKFHEALTAASLEYSGMSWNGFNLFGDRKSIDEAKRLLHEAGTVPALKDRIAALSSGSAQTSTVRATS